MRNDSVLPIELARTGCRSMPSPSSSHPWLNLAGLSNSRLAPSNCPLSPLSHRPSAHRLSSTISALFRWICPETEDHVANLPRLLDTSRIYVSPRRPIASPPASSPTSLQDSCRAIRTTCSRPPTGRIPSCGTTCPTAPTSSMTHGWLNTDAVRQAVFIDNPQSLFLARRSTWQSSPKRPKAFTSSR